MASKRKKGASGSGDAAYQEALSTFAAARETFGQGDFAKAREAFEGVVASNPDEIELMSRARTYIRACDNRLRSTPAPARTADELYYEGVVLMNRGEFEGAREFLDRAIQSDPVSVKAWYSRASLHALRGDAKAAVEDLRRAGELDPTARYQAVNDPDFDSVRDEAAFIDIVEPTPSEA